MTKNNELDGRFRGIGDLLHQALKNGIADQRLRSEIHGMARFVGQNRESLYAADRTSYVKVCAMVAEVADHFGRFDDAASAVEMATDWFGGLHQDLAVVPDDAFKYARECVRANVVAAFVRDYRSGDRHGARSRIGDSLRLMNDVARRSSRKLYATRAQANRYLAEIERSDRNYDKARVCVRRALTLYERRFERERRRNPSADRIREEATFLRHRAALCFLSVARTDYLQGMSAAADAAAASFVLLSSGRSGTVEGAERDFAPDDPLTVATVSLLRALILRNQLGSDPKPAAVRRAKNLLRDATSCFRDLKHEPKLLWATYERAVLLIVARDGNGAERQLERVERLAKEHLENPRQVGVRARRFTAYCQSRRSRIARELAQNRSEAIRYANAAVELASRWSLPRPRLDGLLTRALAVLMDHSAEAAKEAEVDLHAVLDLDQKGAPHDARTRAIVTALTARCRIRQDDVFGAQLALRHARVHAKATEHANVLALVNEVAEEVERGRGDVVLRLDEVSTYAEAEKRLRKYLARAAMALKGSPSKAAALLDIGDSTLYKWLNL